AVRDQRRNAETRRPRARARARSIAALQRRTHFRSRPHHDRRRRQTHPRADKRRGHDRRRRHSSHDERVPDRDPHDYARTRADSRARYSGRNPDPSRSRSATIYQWRTRRPDAVKSFPGRPRASSASESAAARLRPPALPPQNAMKRNLSDYVVALSVIICSAILLAALTIALTGFRFKKPTRTLQIDFEDVTGVKLHSEVRYAGAAAGRVIAMHHLSREQRAAGENKRKAVRVTVSLIDEIPPLPADVIATLSSDTMLSPMFVALSPGTPGGGTLANNAIIDGHTAYGIPQIAAAAGPLIDNANKLIDSLNATVGNLDGTITNVRNDLGQVLPKISPVLDVAKIDLEELQRIIQGLDDVEKNANAVFDNAGKFVGATDKQLQEQMKELRVILLNLKVVSTHAKAITETLGEKPSRIIFGGKTQKLTPESEILKSKEPVPAKKP